MFLSHLFLPRENYTTISLTPIFRAGTPVEQCAHTVSNEIFTPVGRNLQAYQDSLKSDAFNKLISCVKQLNSKIAEDISLGEGFCIGHSYFCGLTPETINTQTLASIVEYELIPLLKEYWFDEPAKIIDWSDRLRSAVK